jgi:hypothetical protein
MEAFTILLQLFQAAMNWLPAEMAGKADIQAAVAAVQAMQADGDRPPNADEWNAINAATAALVAAPPRG